MKEYFEDFPDSYDSKSKRVINTPSSVAKSTFFYVQETGYLKTLKSHNTKREKLDSYLFVIVLSGMGTLNYEGKTYQLKKYDCFFINCYLLHSYQSSEEEPWELLWVHFNGSTTKEYYNYFQTLLENVFSTHNHAKIIDILNELILIHTNKNFSSEILASKLLVMLLTEILTTKKNNIEEPNDTNVHNLDDVRKYMDDNFKNKITLPEVADKFFMSKYHLSREFKRNYGVTFINYIISNRITYSKKLLRFSDKSIEEIASMCGICDASHFTKIFKKSENITATAYRKKWNSTNNIT